MPWAGLAFGRPPLMSGDRSGAPIQLVGPDLERPWPGSCACSTPTPLGVHGSAVDARTERWTEPAERQDDHGHRAPQRPWRPVSSSSSPGRRRRRRPAAGRESAPTPRSPPRGGRVRLARSGGGALVRHRAGSQRRRVAAELNLARRPIRLAPASHREPRPREPRPSRAPEPPAGTARWGHQQPPEPPAGTARWGHQQPKEAV
jgi:hypothetical protein